jgi:tetratricopeptide (TPR) repeat protein
MRSAAIFTAILLSALHCPLSAQGPAADAPVVTPAQQAFLNLPEESRKKHLEFFNEAVRLFQQKRIFETLEQVHEAKKVFDSNPDLMNIEASCYVEIRNFERALEIFKKAEALAPENASVKFNIAEMYFVMKKWQEAHDQFTALMAKVPEGNLALGRLVEFKILLTKMRLGKEEEAFALANKYDFQDDSPFYYYANAVQAYEAKDDVKAEEWLQMGARVFQNPAILSPWQDTLIECGYIKGSYGGEIAP